MKKIMGIILIAFLLFNLKVFGSTQEKSATQFAELANDYEVSLFDYSPELGLFWGKSDVAQDCFMDVSVDGYAAWLKKEDYFLARLNALNEDDLQGTEYTTYLLLKETLAAKKASRICREELWDINPTFGWHNKMAIVAEKQPVGTAEYRRLALSRWQTFGQVVDNQIENLKLGLQLGYSAPKPAVNRVLTQLHIILDSPVEESPYFDFARRDGNEKFKIEIADLIKTVINPAINKYVTYLENDYLPMARSEIGVAALPAGTACYQAKIVEETTLALTPTEVHSLGLQAMQRLTQEVAEIGLKKYGTQEMAQIFWRAKTESANYFTSEQDILDYNFAALDRVKAKVNAWFDLRPKAEGTIRAYPPHRAKTGASGEYRPPNEEGTEPGVFYINTLNPSKKSRIDMEATLFHELIPGHHFQVALVYENKTLPSINRYLFNAGFGEGWALYVERLADEMDLYQDEVSRLGMLSNESLRAARLVVDTGIHAFHWSRERAVGYLRQHTALSDDIIEGEVDRYIMMPGQATAYLLGKNEIEQLRHRAQKQLGDHFDIRQFHNQVLRNGMVSLSILRQQINTWLAQQKMG